MRRFPKLILILISFCLFFNVSLSKTRNLGDITHRTKTNSFFLKNEIKKSNIPIDLNFETLTEEAFQEETDESAPIKKFSGSDFNSLNHIFKKIVSIGFFNSDFHNYLNFFCSVSQRIFILIRVLRI